MQSRVSFNRVLEKAGEGLGGFGAEPGQVRQGFGEGSMQRRFQEALEPHQVQEGSGEGSRKGSGEVGEALVQSQVRFNRVPKKVPEKAREVLVQS